jgi:hypothetical protein
MAKVSRRVIRIFCDSGAEWPLWEHGLMFPEDYGLSAEVTSRLRDWNDYFQEHDSGGKWLVSRESDSAWLERGRCLGLDVEAEVGAFAEVRFQQTLPMRQR